MGNHVQKLLESPVTNKILAESVRVTNEVTQSASGVGPSLFFLVLEKIDEKFDARAQVLVQDFVVEASVSNCKAGKLPCVPVRVLTACNRSLDQAVLQELFIEVASVPAEVTNQVAHFGPNTSIFMANERVQVHVDVGVMDRFIELFRDSCQLRDQ